MATPPITTAGERPGGSPPTPRRAVPRFAVPSPVRPADPPPGGDPGQGHFPAAPRPEDRTVHFAELGRDPPVVPPASSAPTVRVDQGRFHALPPEQEPAETLEDPDMDGAPELRAEDVADLRDHPKRFLTPVRGLVILVLLALSGVVAWVFTGRPTRTPTPLLMQQETAAPAAPAEPEQGDGIRIGTVWTRLPVSVVDGSGGRVQATGPFRLRVDGTVYTLSGEAMPIIPIEPESRIEARAISGTVTLTLNPATP